MTQIEKKSKPYPGQSTTHIKYTQAHTHAKRKIGQGEGGIDVTLCTLWELTPLAILAH